MNHSDRSRWVHAVAWLGVAGLGVASGCAGIAGLGDFIGPNAGAGGSAGAGAIGGAGGAVGGGGTGGAPTCTPATVATDCPLAADAHGTATCDNGLCGIACDSDHLNCNGDLVCEVDKQTDKAHCGTCDTTCAAYCVSGSCNDPVAVSRGWNHTCAILKDGSVWCWGRNERGELGDGSVTNSNVPVKTGLVGTAIQIDASGTWQEGGDPLLTYQAQTCAVLDDSSLWCWGANDAGQLGISSTVEQHSPQQVAALANSVQEVAVGGAHICALKTDRTVYCWGYGTSGQVGGVPNDFDLAPCGCRWTPGLRSAFPGYTSSPPPVQHIGSGNYHSCAVLASDAPISGTPNTLYCWGANNFGQLGTGAVTADSFTPVRANGALNQNLERVVLGHKHGCAWKPNLGAICWGNNDAGQIGDGTANPQLTPIAVGGIPGLKSMTAGAYFTGAIATAGLWMWGENTQGQLGDGTTDRPWSPEQINIPEAIMAGAGEIHSCTLTSTGDIYCSGQNSYGELGNGTNDPTSTPTLVVWPPGP
jgi:alpha-tubulin suppressor-like RCC1 family protein